MKILLATLHAKYVHASLALPYLAAACAGIDGATFVIREFTVNEPPDRILRALVAEEADMVAFSCYIWNTGETLRLASDLKKLFPRTFIVLGGPEVGHGFFRLLEENRGVDCVIRGEGEETFRELVAALSASDRAEGIGEIIHDIAGLACRAGDEIVATPERAPIGELDTIPSPFALGLADLAKPLVYYETSRGCPFSCAFCMSSLEKGVRSFSPGRIEADLALLMEREVATVKLVDRTFNFDAGRANAIWRFILARNRSSRFHFEIAADLLTEENLQLLAGVPAGVFRFEIGVQSGEEETLARVARRSDLERVYANVRRLVAQTGVTVHLDLVAGLPGEDYEGFLRSLQSLFDAWPHHIQIEPLKVLKGSPMRQIAREEGYLYSDTPPYKILRTPWLSFADICRIEAISRLLDLYYNSGRFATTLAMLARTGPLSRLFAELAEFRGHRWEDAGSSLSGLFEAFWDFGRGRLEGDDRERMRDALCYDYCLAEYPAAGRLPGFFPEGSGETGHVRGREKLSDLSRRLGIGRESRVRTFGHPFSRDPRQPQGEGREARLLFVYIATPGKGLEVRVLEDGAP